MRSNPTQQHRRQLTRSALIALCFGAALGCKSGDDDSGMPGAAGMGGSGGVGAAGTTAPAATFTQIFDMMYPMPTNARCTACHAQPPFDVANGNLQMGMDKASVYTALVGKVSTSSKCGGRTYVIPSDPANSLLLQKLTEPPPCGSRMPLGGDMFKPDQLEMIRGWIAAGAPNN